MERPEPRPELAQVENRSSLENIPEPLRPAIDQAKGLYHEVFGDHLLSIYLEGSAGRGDYVEGLSDIDMVGIIDRERTPEDWERIHQGRDDIMAQHGLDKFDASVYELDILNDRPRAQFILAKDGVLLDGKPYEPTATFPPVGPELAKLLAAAIPKRITAAHGNLARRRDGEDIDLAFWSRSVGKQVMRLGLGIAMMRKPVYTASMQDLPGVVKAGVPELSDDVDLLNRAYLEPTDSETDFEHLLAAADRVRALAEAEGVVEPESEPN